MDYLTYISLVMMTALTPGQGILLTVINTLNFGFKRNINTILGIFTAISILSLVTIFLLKAIISVIPDFQNYLQFVGGSYLLYLGYKMFNSHKTVDLNEKVKPKTKLEIYKEAFFISILNPKQIFFLSSVVPLFLLNNDNYYTDMSILIIIFISITISKHFLYSFFANKIRLKITNTTKFLNIVNKISGTIFSLIGIALLVKLFI